MLNVQLDRIDGIVAAMRANRKRLAEATAGLDNLGVTLTPVHSPDHDCGAHLMYLLPHAEAATAFAAMVGGVVAGRTGRHTFTNWDQVLQREGAHHPALNPYLMPENEGTRRELPPGFGARSLDLLGRTVMLPMDPGHAETDLEALAHDIRLAARAVSEGRTEADLRARRAPDLQKFDALGAE